MPSAFGVDRVPLKRPSLGAGRLTLFALALAFLLGGSPAALQAQGEPEGDPAELLGRLTARFVDATTSAPVAGALVVVLTLDRRGVTDSTGTVMFFDLPPGDFELQIRHIAYGERTVAVRLVGAQSTIAAIPLRPQAVSVAPLDVLIEHRPRYLEEREFYDRRAKGLGQFFDPQFIERWNVGGWAQADRFVQLLKDMSPPFNVIPYFCSQPVVYIDGRKAFDDDGRAGGRASTALEMMSTYHIGAVEVYSDVGGVPDFALDPNASCGVIAIWTNRWRDRTRELGGGDIELCEPEDPGATVVEGTIRDEFTGVLLPGAHVLVTSFPVGRTRQARTRDIIADPSARYRVCDLPLDHALTLQVAAAGRTGAEVQVSIESPRVTRDLEIRVAGPGRIAGRVIDRDTGRPVAAADITALGDGSRTQTDAQGFFSMEEVLPGDQILQIAHLGFGKMSEVVSIVADRTVELSVEMSADPIELEPLLITVLRDRRLELRGFYERRMQGERAGRGHFLDRRDLERLTPARTTSLLRTVPGIRVRCRGTGDCSVGSSRGASCPSLNIYVDGTLALGEGRRDPITIDELVLPSEIGGVEVYANAAAVPAEFSGSSGRCGAVVIWTG